MIKSHQTPLFIAIVLLLVALACGQLAVGVETTTPPVSLTETIASATVEETPEPTLPHPTETATMTPTPSPYWTTIEDPRSGVSFAIPCFWQAEIPEPSQDSSGWGAFPIKNYTQEFVDSFGPKGADQIWEFGAIKIDMNYLSGSTWGIPPGTSLKGFVNALYANNSETSLVSSEAVQINQQSALLVTTEGAFGPGQFYVLSVNEDVYLLFGTRYEVMNHPDVQGILNSISLSETIPVQVPSITPSPPPGDEPTACLSTVGTPTNSPEVVTSLSCQAVSPGSAEYVACNVQDGLRSRNLAALTGYMTNPFLMAYWRSEGITVTPEEALDEIGATRLPLDPAQPLTFTADRDQFPDLEGMPVEDIFGPQMNEPLVIYSEGWGEDGQGAALLYIAQNDAGEYLWQGLVIAQDHFE